MKKLYKPDRLYRLLRPEDRLIPSPQPAYGLYEVLRNTTAIRKAIMAEKGTDEIREIALTEGTLTLRMDGLKKVERGSTTLDEVVKETTVVD